MFNLFFLFIDVFLLQCWGVGEWVMLGLVLFDIDELGLYIFTMDIRQLWHKCVPSRCLMKCLGANFSLFWLFSALHLLSTCFTMHFMFYAIPTTPPFHRCHYMGQMARLRLLTAPTLLIPLPTPLTSELDDFLIYVRIPYILSYAQRMPGTISILLGGVRG